MREPVGEVVAEQSGLFTDDLDRQRGFPDQKDAADHQACHAEKSCRHGHRLEAGRHCSIRSR